MDEHAQGRNGDGMKTLRCRNGHEVRVPALVYEVAEAPVIRCSECGDAIDPRRRGGDSRVPPT
jgi:hypothetical protein